MQDVLYVGHASYDITTAIAHQPSANEKTFANAMQLGGAGDALHGALGLVENMQWLVAFCLGGWRLTGTKLGAPHALPDRAAVNTLLHA